jgi:hypothetical protein
VSIRENISNCSTNQQQDIATIEKILIKQKLRTKKELNDSKVKFYFY